jgi:acylphosphatase
VVRARELGVLGWVKHGEDGDVLVHAEGAAADVNALVEALRGGLGGASVEAVEVEPVKPEGHEQFAIRGVDAGRFAVVESAGGRGFELELEVDGAMRRWALPKGPTMDPAAKRMAIGLADGRAAAGRADPAWDEGGYEQGGRVPWPEAIERGHAVFVLHGERLRGGFALQRTRGGERPQWLLIKRRDEEARPGSDVVAESRGG